MDLRDSYLGKRSLSELEAISQPKLEEDDDVPVKKKLRTKLVDIFNRVSISMQAPEDYIKVYLRIKPFTPEEDASQRCYTVTEEDNAIVATAPESSHAFRNTKRGLGKSSHKFTFSKIFNESTSQGDFFNSTMLSMTKDFISGQNSLVFSYGVTSSGKTYTIQGQPQNAGILPRCLDVIFNSINGKQIPSTTTLKPRMFTDVVRLSPSEVVLERKLKERTLKMSIDDDTTVMTLLGDEMESALSDTATSSSSVCDEDMLPELENRDREELKVDVEDQGKIRFGIWVSFAEIYNEQIFDLLEPFPRKKNSKRPPLKICDDRNGNPYIKGLKEIHVESADQAYRLLTIGQRNLQTACTRLNHCSSRSHCMFNIKIVRVVDKDDPHIARVSMLSLCDLAGSERYSKTQATGDRLKEAGNINSSLMTLGRCIETLRYNQLHRDQQRLVPFRDSKLTRLLQNYFNGSGRAVMIVNVSQSVSMFDDTLHVFKFSAIAKQVKHIEKPPEPPKKQKERKVLPPVQRPSIEWEVQATTDNFILKDALNKPLPDDDDDDDEDSAEDDHDENISESCKNIKEMRVYIKTLELRNERLVEMLQEELEASSNIESRVRQEVTQAMMKQVVNIEETYSALLKETNEDAQELADERVRGIMDVYEQRIERIQRKVDEDDEWVSSLLYHQEQLKVQQRDTEIADLKAQVEKHRKEITDSQEKDAKIEELMSLITEAGDVYNKHTAEISQLTEENVKLGSQLSALKDVEIQLKEITASYTSLQQSLANKESEWKTVEEKLNKKIANKDTTITSLQDECKELQDEIERLQDQMSQMDEHSKYRIELETSAGTEHKENRQSNANSSKHADKSTESLPEMLNKTVKEHGTQCTEDNSSKGESCGDMLTELTHLKEEAAKKDKEAEEIKQINEELEKQIKCLQSQVDDLVKKIIVKEKDEEKSMASKKALQATIEQLRKDAACAKQNEKSAEEKLVSSNQENNQIKSEMESVKKVNEELVNKVELLQNEQKWISGNTHVDCLSSDGISTSDVSKHNEHSTALCPKQDKSQTLNEKMDESNDSEIVFNIKMDNTTLETLKSENDNSRKECADLQAANAALKERVQNLEDQLMKRDITGNEESGDKDVNIAEMVRHIEQKSTPFPKRAVPGEVASNKKEVSALTLKAEIDEEMKKTPLTRSAQSSGAFTLAVRLKDAELANAALRSKLKKEEEDYFKREQALIHGYTAEIENLKYDLAKCKSKVDVSGRLLPQRGKRKAMDSSMSSSMSDSISEANVADSTHLTARDNIVKDKQSVIVLSNELLSVQEQLLSLTTEYRRLQAAESRNMTNSFIKDVVLGTPRGRQSAQGLFRLEENVADSVLQFELDEYAVRMDEMRIRISQQDNEILLSKTAFEKVSAEKLEVENKLNEILQKQESQQADELMKLGTVEKESSKRIIEEKLHESEVAYSQLQSEVAQQKEVNTQLKKALEAAITAKNEDELKLIDVNKELIKRNEELQKSELELKKLQETVGDLYSKQDNMIQAINSLRESQEMQGQNVEEVDQQLKEAQNLLKETESELESLKEDLKAQEKNQEDAEAKLADALSEKIMLEQSLNGKSKELDDLRVKLTNLEQNYNDVKETLTKTTSTKDDFEKKLIQADEKLAALRELMNKQEEQHNSRVNVLMQQFSEGEAKLKSLMPMEKQIDELKLQLKAKTTELEKIEIQRQEEGAEVSQKLITLEREKKLAERKATDAKDRELEWQLKCQGLDQMKQNKKTEELERKIKELFVSLAAEEQQKSQLQKSLQDCQENVVVLKSVASECQETMDQQEEIINKQDNDLNSFKAKFDALTAETEKLDQLLNSKELEVTSLKGKISNLEAELTVLHQSEQKVSAVENVCQDKLQKFQSEKRELEDRLRKVEEENRSLGERLNISERQMKKERETIDNLEERLAKTEKQKNDLEKVLESMTDKQKIVEQQLEQANRQRMEELERSCTLKAELTLLRKEKEEGSSEKDKYNGDLMRENTSLKDELHKLMRENTSLKDEIHKLSQDITSKQNELDKLTDTLKETVEKLKTEEKELKKQERINKRNREEMENWKQERDVCVSRIEEHLNVRQQECNNLAKEVGQLKKDNADLVKTVASKDSVIADLRKHNNILSTHMAHEQGLSSPPKIATPDNSVFSRNEFIEDLDTTGHIEIDATPPIAAKKCRKRHARQTHSSTSSVEPEVPTTPIFKSLKPIEEHNENSPGCMRITSPSKSNLHERVAGIASDVMASLSPLTRSAKKRDGKKTKTLTTAPPFDVAPYSAELQNENDNPYNTRKSSRLRTRTKHTAI
ncbi:hypothetical protein BsWGS_05199 [Bradybaena similaris]